ncbi:MAG: hypothetical protein ACHQXA_07750, partial [Gemmatimonadales bacterium]
MARIDKFIQVLAEQKADALELSPGKPAALATAAGLKPLTKDPVTGPQVIALLREVAAGAAGQQLAAGQEASFSYSSPSGDVLIQFTTVGGGSARIRFASAAPAPASRTTVAEGRISG